MVFGSAIIISLWHRLDMMAYPAEWLCSAWSLLETNHRSACSSLEHWLWPAVSKQLVARTERSYKTSRIGRLGTHIWYIIRVCITHYLEIHKSFFVGRSLGFFSSCCNESKRNELITLRCEHLFRLEKMSSLTSAFLGHQTLWKPQPCETEQNIRIICVQFQVEISRFYQKSGSQPPGRAFSYLFRGHRLSLYAQAAYKQ